MAVLPPLAFVDVETTGLSPSENRIAEIGVVTVDGARVERWTSVIDAFRDGHAPSSTRLASGEWKNAPAFCDIASALAARLSGRLLVAHNARFDHAFLVSEFERAGIVFEPKVVCSVMLSRRLFPHLARHDLDSLADTYCIDAPTRHRALPDADLLHEVWQAMHAQCGDAALVTAVEALLAGPLLPSHLDPALITALPPGPGAYVLHGEEGQPLLVGAAGNLRVHLTNYFRVDQATRKALEYSHRITDITWRGTRGILGAQLHAVTLAGAFSDARRAANSGVVTWQFMPELTPAIAVTPISQCAEPFGTFASERKARNALLRLATRHRLCHGVLGIAGGENASCLACPVDTRGCACVSVEQRKKQLLRVFMAIRPLRLQAWPHEGPIGIRERSDLLVVDRWQFLGTARTEGDVHELLETRRQGFDKRAYRLLARTLARLPQRAVVEFAKRAEAPCGSHQGPPQKATPSGPYPSGTQP